MKRVKGFTLVELMIVVAIIGILASVVLGELKSRELRSTEQVTLSDSDLCFDEFKVEEARRDSADNLYCKVDGKWEESVSNY